MEPRASHETTQNLHRNLRSSGHARLARGFHLVAKGFEMKGTLIIKAKRLALALVLSIAGSAVVCGQGAGTQLPPVTDTVRQETVSQQASDSTRPIKDTTTSPSKQTKGEAKKPKRGTWIFAPIPISSPAIGSGLVLAVGYIFKLDQNDKVSPPSTIGLAGAFTNGGTRAGGIAGKLYFKENKYQTTFLLAKGRVNVDFYGIGRIPGRDTIKVPIHGAGTVFFGELLRNVWKDIFVGGRYQRRNLSANLEGIQPPGGFVIPAIDLKTVSAAIGFHVQRDKRDSTFYPRKGSLFDVTGDFFDEALGSRREYQTYKVSYNAYHAVAKKQVVAYRGMVCSANGSVPFYDLCLYGTDSDVRGYTGGQFQNRRMFATQAEYRLELPKRLGVVAFGGVGGIARNWNDFHFDGLLPAAGLGLRFNLVKKNHLNYRIDFAVGREGHTLSIGIGEAF
jgi:hypothetical protein